MGKKVYLTPIIEVIVLENESSIAATSIVPHQVDGTIMEVWEEETIDLGKHTWE